MSTLQLHTAIPAATAPDFHCAADHHSLFLPTCSWLSFPLPQAVVVLDDWMGREHLVEPLPVEAAVPAAVEEGLQNGAAEAKEEAVGIEAIAPPAGERAVTVLLLQFVSAKRLAAQTCDTLARPQIFNVPVMHG